MAGQVAAHVRAGGRSPKCLRCAYCGLAPFLSDSHDYTIGRHAHHRRAGTLDERPRDELAAEKRRCSMLIGIVSDLHGNAAALVRAMELIGQADEWICLGDSIREYCFSNEVVSLLRSRGFITIQGNH